MQACCAAGAAAGAVNAVDARSSVVAVVFDCESDGLPRRFGDADDDFRHVQCTVACALVLRGAATASLDPEAGEELVAWRDVIAEGDRGPFDALFRAFDEADVIVGYNALDFDFPLLKKHYGRNQSARYMAHRCKTLDPFSRVRAATGWRPSLNELAASNSLASKSSDGAQAVRWWEAGRRDELQAYCAQDVRVTARLACLPSLTVRTSVVPGSVFALGPALCATRTAVTLR